MPSNVQFTNKDDVLEAYKKMKVGPWAIWCGTAMNFSCSDESKTECESSLVEYLEMLDRQDVAAYYRLAVYDDMAGEKITNKTPYSSSFNFRLTDSAMGIKRNGIGETGLSGMTVGTMRKQWESERAISDEIKALRMEVQELKEGGTGDDELDDYGLGKIGKILQHPTVGPMAQNLLGSLMNYLNRGAGQPGRTLAGLPGDQSGADKITAALEILNSAVPDFPDILLKLAEMAQRQPASFKMYCDALRGMQF
jgi:hypothetical protein